MRNLVIFSLPFPDKSYNPHPLCLVVYYIPDRFTPSVVPHGNSKSDVPFFPTLPSTALSIKDKCSPLCPKTVVFSVECTAGDIVGASYPGELPRNELQVSNFKCHATTSSFKQSICSEGNELHTVMFQVHLEDKDKKFICDIKAYPDPAIVLGSDQQLCDLERFCCNLSDFCVFTVDPTFSLGDFDVTPTTYCHLLLCGKRNHKPPVMLGPVMIHYRKSFPTYLFLAPH